MRFTENDALYAASEAFDELLSRAMDAGGWNNAETGDLIAAATAMSAFAQAGAAADTARLLERLADQGDQIVGQLSQLAAQVERSRWSTAVTA